MKRIKVEKNGGILSITYPEGFRHIDGDFMVRFWSADEQILTVSCDDNDISRLLDCEYISHVSSNTNVFVLAGVEKLAKDGTLALPLRQVPEFIKRRVRDDVVLLSLLKGGLEVFYIYDDEKGWGILKSKKWLHESDGNGLFR